MRNVAGARPGIGDMATMGQPGKYTLCFAENDEAVFPALPVRRGLAPDVDAVTVLGVSGTTEILPAEEGGTPEAILRPVAMAMHAATAVSGRIRKATRGEQVLLLPPELARLIVQRGWDLARVQRHLFETRLTIAHGDGGTAADPLAVASSPDDIHVIVTGGAGIKMTYLPLWAGGTRTVTRAVRSA
jgi:hypothetical protein